MLVSVIIPCFNVEEYIEECLNSVFNQTFDNLQVICVDNNSTDQTLNKILSIRTNNPGKNIEVLTESRKGASAARNKGLSVSKGEWIQFLDADDLLQPGKIQHQINLLSQNKSTAFIAAASYKDNLDGERIEVQVNLPDAYKALFVTRLGNTCSNLFNSAVLKEINGWNPDLGSSQEMDLMLRILEKNTSVVFDIVPLTVIRERAAGQITKSDPAKYWRQYVKLRSQMISYLKIRRAEYFKSEAAFYYQKFFLQLRRLAKLDPEYAFELYSLHYQKDFVPEQSVFYRLSFRLLGFDKTEKLLSILKQGR
ncbi:MAG: glycosyltransferase family 2 protein [Bacteroidota bacterium]|jgi:glycosyltransferase involved in cell wall biosynthesis|nr:glycosyltransferase family 2 protein [Bacteroidota bacterium]